MTEPGSLPTAQEQNRLAFLRYLPRRIADFERRILRYRFAGWDPKGMVVLAGDAQRLADASANYALEDTRRCLHELGQIVSGHAASLRSPDPKQAERMFALLGAATRSVQGAATQAVSAAAAPARSAPPSTTDAATTGDDGCLRAATPAQAVPDAAPASNEAPDEAPEATSDPSSPAAETRVEQATAPVAHAMPEAGRDDGISAAPPAAEDLPPREAASAAAAVSEATQVAAADAPAVSETVTLAEDIPSLEEAIAIADDVAAQVLDQHTDAGLPTSRAEATASPPADADAHATDANAIEPAPEPEPSPAPSGPETPDQSANVPTQLAIEDAEWTDPAGSTGMRRIFHIHDGNGFADELAKRLEADGHAVESVTDIDELSDLLTCMTPHTLLVDASHVGRLAIVGALRRDAQQRAQPPRHIRMVVMAEHDDLDVRRAAHRAGADLLLFPPFAIDAVAQRLEALHAHADAEPVRVLIVDDQRADALFAQAVLEHAGICARVEHDAMRVTDALSRERADLILMDLHMPFANGVELTMLLRDDPQFARIPIVFLSGESDPDSRLEAINAGGDDFLFKPIRPRNLVEAVTERVRRLHAVET